MIQAAAGLYAALALAIMVFQLALVAGAPWGRLAMGGRWPGRMPPALRVAAAVQAALMVAMGAAMLGAAGIGPAVGLPMAVYLGVLAVTFLSMIANLITPSRAERRLWGPVSVAMTAAGAITVLF